MMEAVKKFRKGLCGFSPVSAVYYEVIFSPGKTDKLDILDDDKKKHKSKK